MLRELAWVADMRVTGGESSTSWGRSSAAVALFVAMGCSAPPAPVVLAAPPTPTSPPAAPSAVASAAPVVASSAVAAPEPPKNVAHETFTMESKRLGETRRLNVYTPPGYADGTTRYPILYLLDGGDEEDFPHPHVLATVDAAIRAGEMAPIVVVGIENTERRRDMTGPTDIAREKAIAPHVGGSAAFRAFLRDELRPAIAARVRGNGRTALMGESLAGLFTVETLFASPELFDVYIAVSPSLFWNHATLAKGAVAWMAAHPKVAATFFLASAGDDDIDDRAAGVGKALEAHAPPGLHWTYESRPELKHATILEAVAPKVLRKLFPPG